MSAIRQIILLTALFCCHAAIAGESCNMNGDWYLVPGTQDAIHFKQTDTSIEGKTDDRPGACTLSMSGVVADNEVNYLMSMKGSGCPDYLTEVKAYFMQGCSWISGTYHVLVAGNYTGPIMLHRVPISIVAPDMRQNLIITAEPKMPEITFKAKLLSQMKVNQFIPPFTWKMDFRDKAAEELHVTTDEVMTMEDTYTPDFHNMNDVSNKNNLSRHIASDVMGGELTVKVIYYQNMQDEKKYKFKGTNPGQIEIEKMITDPVLRKIACTESRYKQFNATREGGIGMPLVSIRVDDNENVIRGGAGIMQLYKPLPTPEEVWNWRENIKAGMELYRAKHREALVMHKGELKRMNDERKKLHLPACESLPPLNADQIERETLRRYNCGREYRWKPWDHPECKGEWVIDPSCRIEHKGGYDAEYVDKVLACNIDK